ncbi:OsmC family protein [Elusimicrobium minutum Pei191]|uniref:OsmC family protein n=1 Tax=Elusimicrobium minutum (strain Pei191) TaxID=445932 RepID=B2KB72_ELUMP|nr:OsmC family protein [Elusimicrobium minutum]ACC97894.1 OsmC family protein [Elusimicrobium minutum Pei191]
MVKTKYTGNMKIAVEVGGFTVNTDLPAAHKGDNTAPNPFDLFLASFAACTAVFALFYLDKHGLSKEGVNVDIEPAYTKEGMVDNFKVFVTIPETFPKEHETGLKTNVESCKVGKHIKPAHEVIIVRK